MGRKGSRRRSRCQRCASVGVESVSGRISDSCFNSGISRGMSFCLHAGMKSEKIRDAKLLASICSLGSSERLTRFRSGTSSAHAEGAAKRTYAKASPRLNMKDRLNFTAISFTPREEACLLRTLYIGTRSHEKSDNFPKKPSFTCPRGWEGQFCTSCRMMTCSLPSTDGGRNGSPRAWPEGLAEEVFL